MTAAPELFNIQPSPPAPLALADRSVTGQIDHLARFLDALGHPRNHPEIAILRIAHEALLTAERYAIQAEAARRAQRPRRAIRLNQLVYRLLWLAESHTQAVSIYRSHY